MYILLSRNDDKNRGTTAETFLIFTIFSKFRKVKKLLKKSKQFFSVYKLPINCLRICSFAYSQITRKRK